MSRDRKDITIRNSMTSIDTRGDTRIEEGILIDKRTHLTLRVLPNFRGRKKKHFHTSFNTPAQLHGRCAFWRIFQCFLFDVPGQKRHWWAVIANQSSIWALSSVQCFSANLLASSYHWEFSCNQPLSWQTKTCIERQPLRFVFLSIQAPAKERVI